MYYEVIKDDIGEASKNLQVCATAIMLEERPLETKMFDGIVS